MSRRAVVGGSLGSVALLGLGVQRALAAETGVTYPDLRLGITESRHNPVRTAQYLLRRWTPGLAVDGSFGYGTRTAVKTFQSREGLRVTGALNYTQDWERILLRSTATIGGRGSTVTALQRELNASGQAIKVTVDGIFGPRTQDSVISYQRHVNHLAGGEVVPEDGHCGQATWIELVRID